ncbi:MAG: putative MobA-like protein [Dehalococcoidia bacterium]|nr:putative MobA-like protein [Dehalococcoidia bacterium]
MGKLKALLPWRGSTLIEHQIESLQRAGVVEVVVVVGHMGKAVEARVKGSFGVVTVANPDYRQGKTTSIRAGLKALSPDAQGILILAVDQPRPARILESLIQVHLEGNSLITGPLYRGRSGHPLIFSRRLLPELMSITEEGQGLREITHRHRENIYRLEVDSPLVTVDINSPEDLREAERLSDDLE